MAADAQRLTALHAVRVAQRQFEEEAETAQHLRRAAFAQAQEQGLSLREIGEQVGLHRSRVAQIIKGE